MKLSLRLEAVKNFIPPGCVVADVGADRGELSYSLLEADPGGRKKAGRCQSEKWKIYQIPKGWWQE